VRLTEAEYIAGQDYIEKHHGLDSDAFRWFTVGVEGLPRARALHDMTVERELVETASGTIWAMEARESKTEYYNKGRWPKYITGDRTKKAIEAAEARGRHVITERNFEAAKRKVYPALRAVYRELGLDKKHLVNQNDPESAYAMKKPSHALRHIGAQRWLRITGWNLQFVASMGWRSPAELTASYGAMPAEAKLELLGRLKI